ncbi:MAG: YbhB/YbcL family Raf kinase inhibitor-like protein [Planctomycetes bacterium]|nr:YbhB/YbcL family Raf kinase inhibitor-like protein [Planctomycetota bacterium]
MTRAALTLLLLVLAPAGLLARGGPPKAPPAPQVTADGDLSRLELAEPAGTVGYLYVPKSLPEGEKGGLVVMLHGHGGTPKGVVQRELAEQRKWLFLSVQGGGSEETPQGPGFSWSSPDVEKVIALTRAVLATRPVDASKVVLFGFSAGGTMVLATFPQAPELYAGILTCSSPQVPGPAHAATRVVVFLGTNDPNYRGATAVRSALEEQKAGGLALMVVEGAEHNDLPATPYVDLALDFVLAKTTFGHEAKVPKAPPAATAGHYRHILVSFTGAAGAPKGLERKKASAKSIAEKSQKAMKAGRVFFPHEAQAFSDDRETGPIGGRIDRARLLGFGVDEEDLDKALFKLKEGEAAGPFESKAGWHLVVPEGSVAGFELSSPAFKANGPIPVKHTGHAEDVSPALAFRNVPKHAKELALVCDDPDAPSPEPWVHWVVYRIRADSKGLPEGFASPGTAEEPLEGANSWPEGKTMGWRGPMPPSGTHHYRFVLYALDAPLGLAAGASKADLLKAMEGHILAKASLTGTFAAPR